MELQLMHLAFYVAAKSSRDNVRLIVDTDDWRDDGLYELEPFESEWFSLPKQPNPLPASTETEGEGYPYLICLGAKVFAEVEDGKIRLVVRMQDANDEKRERIPLPAVETEWKSLFEAELWELH